MSGDGSAGLVLKIVSLTILFASLNLCIIKNAKLLVNQQEFIEAWYEYFE